MSNEEVAKLRFRPRARIIRTIGDQLISGPEAAVIELVKNAYDADATSVVLKFYPPLEAGAGRITVQDDGHGMTLSDIQDKWMEPATTSKVGTRLSPDRNRVMMGYKGIGRFAAAKLGGRMALNSTSERGGNRVEVLIPELDWSIFDGDTYLSDIAIDFYTEPTDGPTGTLLEILDLREAWTEPKINRLLLELRRLISPLQQADHQDDFDIFLDLSECTVESCGFDGRSLLDNGNASVEEGELEKIEFKVQPFPLLKACDYELTGSYDSSGQFSGTFRNRRAGTGPEQVSLIIPFEGEEQSCGPFDIRLFLFDREADTIKNNMREAGLGDLTAAKARQILDEIAGIAIYRSGFRVRPYGDSENDWLTLDRRRVQNPSLHIGHNQVAGYVTVQDQETSGLEERSSREGFEENGAFRRLKRLVEVLLTRVVEPKRYHFRSKAGISRKRSVTFDEVRNLAELQKLRLLVSHFEPSERAEAESLIDKQAMLLSDRIDQLEDRARVLEAKSSLGAILAEILHEGTQPAAYVASTAARLKGLFPDLFGGSGPRTDTAKGEFDKKLPLVAESGTRLVTLFRNLKPLAGGKRGLPKTFNLVNVIRGAIELFSNHMTSIEIENPDKVADMIGYPEDLTTALVNIIGNSLHWLEDAQTLNPQITISIRGLPTEAVIYVDDNGPGVKEEFAELIFDVGFSLKSDGTGLGLNIAREALSRSDATLSYHMDFQGGTRFEIRFPRVEERR
ncbi:sensor histidine kinase [Sphingorhabdus sp.]|uniref:sensor histidine kinase n=1 Tax=Sphingorhabdus sp. TaxID=1902408 RepID=UPI0032B7D272